MVQEKGTISINTENIFPIIKKFLYSDHEIFLRELVSNAVDATQKIKRLASLGSLQQRPGRCKSKSGSRCLLQRPLPFPIMVLG